MGSVSMTSDHDQRNNSAPGAPGHLGTVRLLVDGPVGIIWGNREP